MQPTRIWLGLRLKLMLVLLVIGLLPLITTGVFNILSTGDTLRDRVIDEEQAKLQARANEIERFLGTTVDDIHLLHQSVVMRTMVNAIHVSDILAIQPARQAVIEEFQNFVESRNIGDQHIYVRIRFLDPDGFEFVRVEDVNGRAESVTDLNFRTSEDYFVNARDLPNGEVYVSPINLFDDYGRIQTPYNPVLQYSVPVYASDTFAGVLVTDVHAQGFLDLVQADLPADSTALLVDQDGTYLSHPNPAYLYGRDLRTGLTLLSDHANLQDGLTDPSANAIELPEEVAFYQRIVPPGQQDRYWVLFALRPLSAVLSPVRQLQYSLLIALIVVGVLVAGTAYLFARSIGLPIADLTHSATAIAGGNLRQRVRVSSRDELGQLAAAFNTMTENLAQTIGERNARIREVETLSATLEQRVIDRTRDLQIAADVSRQITTVLDIDLLLQQVASLTVTSYNLFASFVFLPTADGSRLVWAAGADSHGQRVEMPDFEGIPFDADPSLVARAARAQHTIAVNDTTQSDLYLGVEPLLETRSEVAIPILLGNQLLGIFDVQSEQANHFTEDDIRVMETLAEQIGIAVRNAQLFHEAQVAREAAEEASKVKSQFLANMSHELRTPLNAIMNFTGFIADGLFGPVNDEQVENLNKVLSSGQHLLSLINDILDLTKIEVGMMDLFIQDVNVNEALTSLLSTAKGLVKDKPIQVKTDIEDHLPVIQGDRRRVRQVLLNLMSNAVKFTPEGTITISAHYRDGEIQIAVADTGVGIAEDQQHVVFETFRQAKHELQETPGTGLGMPISKAFVEAHGGTLTFETQAGVGTTFYVTLPVPQAAVSGKV